MCNKQHKRMFMTKYFVQNHVLVSVLLVTALRAAMGAASESDRLHVKRAVEQLQKRNATYAVDVLGPVSHVLSTRYKEK